MLPEALHTLKITGMEFYAYHGCMPQEGKVGGRYRVDVEIKAPLQRALYSDRLEDTVDYVKVHECVKEEINSPSHLIEHVAQRIMNRLKTVHENVRYIRLEIIKLRPPIPGNVEQVSFILEENIP